MDVTLQKGKFDEFIYKEVLLGNHKQNICIANCQPTVSKAILN